MKIENVEVYGFQRALHGMRNPKNSWDRADSVYDGRGYPFDSVEGVTLAGATSTLGPRDLKLALNLIRSGTDHRKFLRQIFVVMDITIPRYVWQELDTYKVATVRNSCSTMHRLGHADLTLEDFQDGDVFPEVLARMNDAGRAYREKRSFDTTFGRPKVIICGFDGRILEGYDIVRWMKRHTPEGFLQMATYSLSYETVIALLGSRGTHRLAEWSGPGGICETLRALPLVLEFEVAAKGS
jgi:hypothetical protein